jgi:hypothetical protein
MSPHTPAAKRWRAISVFAIVMLAFVLLVTLLLWRAHRTDITAKRLCQVLSVIVQKNDHRLNSVAYYHQHPDELKRAHADNRDVLKRLACTDLPPVKGKP